MEPKKLQFFPQPFPYWGPNDEDAYNQNMEAMRKDMQNLYTTEEDGTAAEITAHRAEAFLNASGSEGMLDIDPSGANNDLETIRGLANETMNKYKQLEWFLNGT